MNFWTDIYSPNKRNSQELFNLAEWSHYPEDDLVITELIKVLSKQSRDFSKKYKSYMDSVIENLKSWSINTDYYEQEISAAINEVSTDATELQKTENLMKWLKYLWLWNRQFAKEFLAEEPIEENIRTIAIPFTQYADWFIRSYLKNCYEVLKKSNKVPNYIQALRKTFCSIAKRHATSQIKKLEFNENTFKESFSDINTVLEKKWITIPATDDIKWEFIRLCRERFPLAKNNYNQIFESKKFKNEFIEKTISWLDEFLDDYYSKIIKNTEDFIALWFTWEKHWYIVNNVLLNYNTFIKEEYWEDNIIGKYFLEIYEAFEKDHNRKLKNQEKKKIAETKPVKEELIDEIPVLDEKAKKGRRYALSEEQNSLIKEAIQHINCSDEKKRSIEKFITKLIIKDFPLKLTDLKKIFNLEGIPKETVLVLTEKLWIEYQIGKDEPILDKKEKKDDEEKEDNKQEQPEIIIEDPIEYFINRIESFNYIIPNKNLLTKQITEFCKNSTYETVLTNQLKNPEFWKVLYHRWWHKKARVLPIWRTGWRLLLIKEWKEITVDSFCNHNDYRDRLVEIKN